MANFYYYCWPTDLATLVIERMEGMATRVSLLPLANFLFCVI